MRLRDFRKARCDWSDEMKAARNQTLWVRAREILENRRLRTLVGGVLLVAVWMVPGYLLASVHHSLEYDFVQNVRVAASQDSNFLLPLNFGGFEFIPEHQGSEILKLVLVKLTGVDIEDLQYFPVGAFLVPLSFYILSKELLNPTIAALLSISVALDPTIVFGSYHTAIYAWSRILLLAFLFLYVKIVKGKNQPLVILTHIVFIAAFSIYWTGPALMVIYSILINGLLLFVYLYNKDKKGLKTNVLTISSSLTFVIIYLGFGEILYRYLPRIVGSVYSEEFSTATLSLYRRVLQLIGVSSPDPEVFVRYGSDSAVQTVQVVRYALMGVAVAWLLLLTARRWFKNRHISVSLEPDAIVLISVIGMLLTHTLLYAAYGHASTRYLALLGPMICGLALKQSQARKWIKVGAAVALGVLACVGFSLAFQRVSERSDWDIIRAGKDWLESNAEGEFINSNVGTYAMLAMELARDGEPLDYNCFTIPQYDSVINRLDDEEEFKPLEGYVVIDKNVTDHELCPGFRYYEPFSHYLEEISENTAFDAVYDNGGLLILRPR
jgi:hypothetical protein